MFAQSVDSQAPAPDPAADVGATAVHPVVVTANRFPQDAEAIGQSVTVLTEPMLRLDQETSVADVLARTPGVTLARNGGPGQTTSLFIRGGESNQTVVLIDGVKVDDPTSPGAGYDFSNLIVGDVMRIEVLRGAQSTLYGSEAIGGVVNIVTADATRPLQGRAQLEGGSYGTGYANAAVGGHQDRFDWRVGAYYDHTDSVSAFDRALGGRETDAFNTAGASARFRYALSDNLQFDERAYFTSSRTEFDGYDTASGNPGDDAEFGRTQQLVDYTGFNLSLFDNRLKNRVALEYSGISRRYEDPNQPETKFTFLAQGRTTTAEYEGTFAVAPGYEAVFGAQSEHSTIGVQAPYYVLLGYDLPTHAAVTLDSGYAEFTGEVLPGLTLNGGARYDHHSTFGGHVTGQGSAAWKLDGGNTVLRTSYAQGFRAPSLYQLFSTSGNTALRPEQSDGWDIGVEQHFLSGAMILQATYFARTTRDLINFVSCYDVTTAVCAPYQLSTGYYDNVARARADGLELQGLWTVTQRLDLAANYTYDDTRDHSAGSPNAGLQLARRPKDTANLSGSYVWPVALRTNLALRYAGESFDDDAHLTRLKAYTLVDLRVSYPLRTNLELYGRIENLTDRRYETAYQFGTLGRAAYAGLRASF